MRRTIYPSPADTCTYCKCKIEGEPTVIVEHLYTMDTLHASCARRPACEALDAESTTDRQRLIALDALKLYASAHARILRAAIAAKAKEASHGHAA